MSAKAIAHTVNCGPKHLPGAIYFQVIDFLEIAIIDIGLLPWIVFQQIAHSSNIHCGQL